MALDRYRNTRCDGCDTYFDGDPIDLIERNATVASGIKRNDYRAMVTHFWLCAECSPDYPNGAKDFFISEVFSDEPVCASCALEYVESEGHYCDDCDTEVEE